MVCVIVSEFLVGALDVVCEDSEAEALVEALAELLALVLEQPAHAASETARHALNANVPAFLAKGVCPLFVAKGVCAVLAARRVPAALLAKRVPAALLAKRVRPALVFPLQDFIFPP
jgi:hypothetical protein